MLEEMITTIRNTLESSGVNQDTFDEMKKLSSYSDLVVYLAYIICSLLIKGKNHYELKNGECFLPDHNKKEINMLATTPFERQQSV